MSKSPEAGWGAEAALKPVLYEELALGVLNYLDESQLRMAQAFTYNAQFGGAAIGGRQSLASAEQIMQLRRDINETLTELHGIHMVVGEEDVHLVRWLGPDPENPAQGIWLGLGLNPHNPFQPTTLSINTASLRGHYEELVAAVTYQDERR